MLLEKELSFVFVNSCTKRLIIIFINDRRSPHRQFIFDDIKLDISGLKDNTLTKMATVLGHHCNVTILYCPNAFYA